MDIKASLSFLSHNTTGWSDHKADTLNTLLSSLGVSFGALQEHMQLSDNLHRISSKLLNYIVFSIPAFKRNDIISKGRPSGGLSFLVKKGLEHYVNHIIVPGSKRVHGLTIKLPEANFVLINCYFPTDPQCNNFDDTSLLETLEDIRYLLNSCDNCQVPILCGDFNADFSRNSRFVNIVSDFLTEYNLKSVWGSFDCDFTFCQPVSRNNQVFYTYSTIDHFFLNEHLIEDCENATVLHFGENLSNHDAIFLKLRYENLKIVTSDQKSSIPSKPNWKNASPQQINLMIEKFREGVSNICAPNNVFNCRNVHCTKEDHLVSTDVYALEVLTLLEDIVGHYIPMTDTKKNRRTYAGWNCFVKPIKQDLNFWFSVWQSAGRPLNCELHRIYQRLRHTYHYEIRRLKRLQQEIKNDNFINAALSGNINDILSKLKRQRKGERELPGSIDNIQGEENISNHFQNIYKNIYNHHPINTSLSDQYITVDDKICQSDICWVDKITPSLLRKIILKLNPGKNDEQFKFKSDALKHTVNVIAEPLANIFKAYLVHGHVSKNFLMCSLRPILKDNRKSASQSNNYRLIAISSLLLKLIDLLILELLGDKLVVSSLQFGFEKDSSTTLCTWTLSETIKYYTNRDTPIYLCFLDLTKAFDHVKLDVLFNKLQKRLPYIFVRLLIYTYIVQQCYVNWGSSQSDTFTISNGVRQGAVASPIFFNVYIDELFNILKNSKIGCTIGQYYYGGLGYADDISLLCPTREGLQKLIDLVKSYCDGHGIRISTDPNPQKSKTKVLLFNFKSPAQNIKLYGQDIPYVNQWEHLGHLINNDGSTSHDILRSRAVFISKVHSLHQELGKVHPKVFLDLVQIYLSSFYGATLWDLESAAAHKLYSTYNTMIRDTYDLPYGTHRFILKDISCRPPLKQALYNRFAKFSERIEKCKKPEVNNLFHVQKLDSLSVFGRNYKFILVNKNRLPSAYNIPDEDTWRLPLIREILDIKYGDKNLDNFSGNMLDIILNQICTD